MKDNTIIQIISELKKLGFEDVEYNKKFENFHFHNNSDIMNNYVTVTYSSQFKKFNVQIHRIETSNATELTEVAKRIYKLANCIKKLNAILDQDGNEADSKLVI